MTAKFCTVRNAADMLPMISGLDIVMLEQESHRLGTALTRLRFIGRCGRMGVRRQRSDTGNRYEIELAELSVAEFRFRCS